MVQGRDEMRLWNQSALGPLTSMSSFLPSFFLVFFVGWGWGWGTRSHCVAQVDLELLMQSRLALHTKHFSRLSLSLFSDSTMKKHSDSARPSLVAFTD